VRRLRYLFRIALDALDQFLVDDGWAIASHIALSALMALFPFLIVITSLAGFFGSAELADEAADLLLESWPDRVAQALSGEIHNVLTTAHGGVLTVGVVLAVYFASNGVESLRVALNRAYSVIEPRRWYWLRLESIGYTLLAALVLLALAFLIVLAPLLLAAARAWFPIAMQANERMLTLSRYGVTIGLMTLALFIVHKWLPAGVRSVQEIWPGIALTIAGSLAAGVMFGLYLGQFAENYVTTYAGLASVIIALVFLYFVASIFVYGGEFNAAIMKTRLPRARAPNPAAPAANGLRRDFGKRG
jgi:membrane protein